MFIRPIYTYYKTVTTTYECFANPQALEGNAPAYVYLKVPYAVDDYPSYNTSTDQPLTSTSQFMTNTAFPITAINDDGTVTCRFKAGYFIYTRDTAHDLTDTEMTESTADDYDTKVIVSYKYYAFTRKKLVSYYKYDPNFELVGNPMKAYNGDGDFSVAGGWGNNAYIKLNETFVPGSNAWEFGIKSKGACRFLGSSGRQWLSVMQVTTAGKMNLVRGDGSQNLISQTGNTALPLDEWVWVRFSFDGNNTYKFEYSLDGITYVTDKTFTSSTKMENLTQFGAQYDSGSGLQVGSGFADMKEAYIKINGEFWWVNKYLDERTDYKRFVAFRNQKYY